MRDKSCAPDDSAFPDVVVQLQYVQSADCTRARVPYPDVSGSNRDGAGAEVVRAVSLDYDNLADRRLRDTAQCVFPAILENECNGFSETCPSFSRGPTLTVRSRNLRAVSDEPVLVSLNNCRELVMHGGRILPEPGRVTALDVDARNHRRVLTTDVTRLTSAYDARCTL